MDLDAILEKIASVYAEHALENNFDVSKITDFEQVKDNIIAKVFGTEHNEQLLSNKPYRMMADLAVTYHIMLEQNADGVVSVPITDSLMNEWGVTEDVLFTASKNNMSRLTPVVVKGMFETLCDMQGAESLEFMGIPSVDPADEMMFVMYNTSKLYGAAAMIDPNNMDYARNLIQSDFYILPSSVHEVLLVKTDMASSVEELESMVQQINGSEVEPQDRLSDHVYKYDYVRHEIYRADQELQRQAELDAQQTAHTIRTSGR